MTEYQLKRSVLYTPAVRMDRVRKVMEEGRADVVVADLEDGVSSMDRSKARQDLAALLARPPSSRTRLAVRINAWPGRDSDLDLKVVQAAPPPLLVIPKVESGAALEALDKSLKALRIGSGLLAQVETAKGLLEADRIAAAPRVEGVVFGSEDYAADVGAVRTTEGWEVLYARSRVVACAAAAGVDAIDQIWADYKDLEGFRTDAVFGARLGFAGKQLIHPDQIEPTHAAFRPTPLESERARRIVEAADAAGGGVVVVDDRMIDRPLVEQARRVLRRAQAPA